MSVIYQDFDYAVKKYDVNFLAISLTIFVTELLLPFGQSDCNLVPGYLIT
jgi:hypothetical protein